MALTKKLTAIAAAIRGKTGGSDPLTLDGMAEAITGLELGSEPVLEPLEVTENGTYTPDEGVDGFDKVTVEVGDPLKQRIEGTLESYSSDTSGIFTDNLFKTHSSIFDVNRSLKSLSLPNVTHIGNGMCQNCGDLTSFEHNNAITFFGDSCFSYCGSLELEIRNAVPVTVEASAFSNSGLQIFDSEIVSLGAQAFINSRLHTLVIRNEELLALSHVYVITGTPLTRGEGYVYVPSRLVEEYKAATNWATIADQFRAIEDYPEITGG